jgi:hypothetical protein
MKTVELWRYIGVQSAFWSLLCWSVAKAFEIRRLRKRVKELEDYIRTVRPGNLVRGGGRLGGGSVLRCFWLK